MSRWVIFKRQFYTALRRVMWRERKIWLRLLALFIGAVLLTIALHFVKAPGWEIFVIIVTVIMWIFYAVLIKYFGAVVKRLVDREMERLERLENEEAAIPLLAEFERSEHSDSDYGSGSGAPSLSSGARSAGSRHTAASSGVWSETASMEQEFFEGGAEVAVAGGAEAAVAGGAEAAAPGGAEAAAPGIAEHAAAEGAELLAAKHEFVAAGSAELVTAEPEQMGAGGAELVTAEPEQMGAGGAELVTAEPEQIAAGDAELVTTEPELVTDDVAQIVIAEPELVAAGCVKLVPTELELVSAGNADLAAPVSELVAAGGAQLVAAEPEFREDTEYRSGLDSIKMSAISVLEEMELQRTRSSSLESEELSYHDDESLRSVEEMHIGLVRRSSHFTSPEEQPRTDLDTTQSQNYQLDSNE